MPNSAHWVFVSVDDVILRNERPTVRIQQVDYDTILRTKPFEIWKTLMLRSRLIHPAISRILAEAGHHATILIADGNYPASSKRGPRSELVSLNLMPGLVSCNQVLEAILSAVSVEAIQTMITETSGPYALEGDPPVWAEYRETIRKADIDVALEPIEKWEFYNRVSTVDHVLTVQTGDTQRYANILLTVGVRMF